MIDFSLADAAIDAWKQAIETGETADLTALCSEGLVFAIPMAVPEWAGEQHGPARLAELVAFEKSTIHKGMTVEVVDRTYGASSAAVRVQCSAIRRDTGEPFTSPLVVTFRFDGDGRVDDLREWTWNLRPEDAAREAGLIP